MTAHSVTVDFRPTPEIVAAMYWQMGSDEQADFFAHLDRIAGGQLCMQAAYLVSEIAGRAANGDRTAQHGFQTMFHHSADYVLSQIETAAWRAQREIARMAEVAKVPA